MGGVATSKGWPGNGPDHCSPVPPVSHGWMLAMAGHGTNKEKLSAKCPIMPKSENGLQQNINVSSCFIILSISLHISPLKISELQFDQFEGVFWYPPCLDKATCKSQTAVAGPRS